jgi:SAM-dependent methyltransferase
MHWEAAMSAQHQAEVDGVQGQDPTILREQAYADDTQLDIRHRTHQLYTVDPVDFGRWTLERLPWRGDERVLDVGCGPGDLLREMARQSAKAGHLGGWSALVGFDFSAGMASKAASSAAGLPVHFIVADAQSVPFPDGSFDVVMARHMLYHVPDIDRAVAEAARVLRPGGYFLTMTNSAGSMAEYQAIREQAAGRYPAINNPQRPTARFSLEDGPAFLEPHFDRVETHTLPGTLRFPTAQPFVDYFASARALIMRPGHSDVEWQEVLAFVQAETEAIIASQGHLDVTKVSGAIVGVKGFVRY